MYHLITIPKICYLDLEKHLVDILKDIKSKELGDIVDLFYCGTDKEKQLDTHLNIMCFVLGWMSATERKAKFNIEVKEQISDILEDIKKIHTS